MAKLTEKQINILLKAAKQLTWVGNLYPYEESWIDKAAADGTNTRTFGKVGPRRLRVITHVAALNAVTSCTFIKLCHRSSGRILIDKVGVAPLIGETVNWDGFRIMGEGGYDEVSFLSCSSGDDLYAMTSGYEIMLED